MENITYNNSLRYQTKSNSSENSGWANYTASILLSFGGGLLCGLLGILSFAFFTLSGGHNAMFNRVGMGLVIIGAIMLGFGAHFMDKSDDRKRQYKKSRVEKFNQK